MKLKSWLRSLTPPLLYQALHVARMKIAPTAQYAIGKHVISIPGDHNLPAFQGAHRLYDRFLPVLCSKLPTSGIIVDVGANIGDTVAAVMQVCSNPIIAIEGHRPYFDLLRANLDRIDAERRVTALEALVGTGALAGTLVASRGTATLDSRGSAQMRSLDDILSGSMEDIVLLKVDTDGFDADVICSGMAMIKVSQPLLFWEGGTSGARSFSGMYERISGEGYDKFWVFDNFGNLLLSECSTKELSDLDRYIESVHRYHCTTAIYYVDVLASAPKMLARAREAVACYRREYIESTRLLS